MPVQYVEAQTTGGESARAALSRLSDAVGVAGVSDDGRLVALLDVGSGAQLGGGEHAPWDATLQAASAREVRVEPAVESSAFVAGVPVRCGFAQVLRGRVPDRFEFERVLRADAEWLARERPEILGGLLAWHGGNRFTLVVCFTDEAAARAGEAKNAESPGADIDQLMDDVTYVELRDPWTRPA
ncbi:MAG: hypothetical protein ACLGIG_02060 [Actinomycetes bacterium]